MSTPRPQTGPRSPTAAGEGHSTPPERPTRRIPRRRYLGLIVLAVIVNGLVKGGIALSLGSVRYGRRTAAILAASSVVGAAWFVWDLL